MKRPGPRLELRQKQRLSLTPELQQSLGILALPGASLEEVIAEAAAENPFLVVTPLERASVRSGNGQSVYDVAMLTVPARPSLGEHLCNQIALMDLKPDVTEAAKRLAYDLDENGFFVQTSASQIAAEHQMGEALAGRAIEALQSCEPTGIAAMSLSECISLQLAERGVPPQRLKLVISSLPTFTPSQTETIAPAPGMTAAEVDEMRKLLRSLDPAPGRAFDHPEPIARIPEIVVASLSSGGLSAELVNDPLPRLGIDSQLAAARGDMAQVLLSQAQALIRSVKFRGKTLLAVAEATILAQEAYFSGRSNALAPLTRTALADQLGLHKTTIGRAISGKSLLWRGRVLTFESLFPATLEAADGTSISSHAAQLAIARFVGGESPETVLSDEAICAKLKEDGVDISRRTVAKYRQCMNIPPSSARRRQLIHSAARRRKS